MRQKHNGMSWSKSGSVSLATITALKRNKESDKWFKEKKLTLSYQLNFTRTGRKFCKILKLQ